MKKIFAKNISIVIVILAILLLSACNAQDIDNYMSEVAADDEYYLPVGGFFSFFHMTFEEAILDATDVVKVQYVGSRPHGRTVTEFEFIVLDRVVGNAADRIFVYASRGHGSILDAEANISFSMDDLSFSLGTTYLLPLIEVWQPHTTAHEDGYLFIRNIIINLDDPAQSTMFSQSLFHDAVGLDFSSTTLSSNQVVSYVADITKNNPPSTSYIRSHNIEEIIKGSPYVLIVEINEPFSLNRDRPSDWMQTDIYYFTVVRSLKGDIGYIYEFMVFFADTVRPGEQHIVAVRSLGEGSLSYEFTSRNSLFNMSQLDEIMEILNR